MPAGNKPCLTLSGPGGVQLSIWKNRNHDGKEWYSCKISRRYQRKGSDQWETTDSLGARDLPVVALLCGEAASRIGIREFGPGLAAPAAVSGDPPSPTEEDKPEEKTPF